MADAEVTTLLTRAADGEAKAVEELLPRLYDELRALADHHFRNERGGHTLQPTALVHEVYVRLADQPGLTPANRNQFFVIAAKAMRNVLVDHARARGRLKRGGDRHRIDLDPAGVPGETGESLDLEALDAALSRLAELDERKAHLVELRFFVGLTSEAAAEVLGISRTLASTEWRVARAWLYRELGGEERA